MGRLWLAAIALLVFSRQGQPSPARESQPAGTFGAFYGWKVDSITVSGNSRTKDFVLVREMETRPGSWLQPEVIARDVRYLEDLGLFASIHFSADSLRPGRCALRIEVEERSSFFLKMLIPVVNYDFDDGFSFGLRWRDRNFRGRRERLYASYLRENDGDQRASMGWYAPWLGWNHIPVLGDLRYFHREADVADEPALVESVSFTGSVGVPLTESRMSFSQVLASVGLERRHSQDREGCRDDQVFLSPVVGIWVDNRDSRLRPHRGGVFFLDLQMHRAVAGRGQVYFRLRQNSRIFVGRGRGITLALLSGLTYQFGDYPSYSTVGLGGSSTLRGYRPGQFSGDHRWYQTLELRYEVLPKEVFRLPYLGLVDVGISFVAFIDGGLVWQSERDFHWSNYHGGAGLGIRLYSPFQDVVRFDVGFNRAGDVLPYVGTGVRF